MQPFPHPNDAPYKIQKCEIFVTQGQVTPKWVVWFGPKSNSTEPFMPVLVTSNFDDDLIKNEWATMETAYSHYKSIGIFLDAKTVHSEVSGPIWQKFELVRDFMHVLVTYKYITRIRSKATEKSWRHHFPHYKSMGAFCCHGHQSASKHYAAFPQPQWCYT